MHNPIEKKDLNYNLESKSGVHLLAVSHVLRVARIFLTGKELMEFLLLLLKPHGSVSS